jgi:hypothetical protein
MSSLNGGPKKVQSIAFLADGTGYRPKMCEVDENFRQLLATMVRMPSDGKTHRVYLSFMRNHGWYCQFREPDLRTSLPRTFPFASEDKLRELVERGGGMVDSETRNMVDHAIDMGRGGVYLNLTDEQYSRPARTGQ